MRTISKELLDLLRKRYPAGTRVELISMNDAYAKLPKGSTGSVISVDDLGTIHVCWDCGSSLGIAYGEDKCKPI